MFAYDPTDCKMYLIKQQSTENIESAVTKCSDL